jgi:hypothetical protein
MDGSLKMIKGVWPCRLEPEDSRTTYDEKTGAVRSFFGAELVAPMTKAKRALANAE